MTVWFINRFYWPDETATAQLLSDLCTELISRGFKIRVICSGTKSSSKSDTHFGIGIHRVSRRSDCPTSIISRAFDYLCFGMATNVFLLKNLAKGDFIIALTDPPLLGMLIHPAIAIKKCKLLQWMQDIYPDVAEQVIKSHIIRLAFKFLRYPRDYSFRRSSACVTLGNDMKQTLMLTGIPATQVHVIPNWAPQGIGPASQTIIDELKNKWGIANKFIVSYSGNFGRVHELKCLIKVAELLAGYENIIFLMIGGGVQKTILESEAQNCGLKNMIFRGPSLREELSASLSIGDLHLVTLRPECSSSVFPSKLYGIAAVGRPVIFIGSEESEIATTIRTRNMGKAFSPEKSEAIAEFIYAMSKNPTMVKILGEHSLLFGNENGSADRAARAWIQILSDLALLD